MVANVASDFDGKLAARLGEYQKYQHLD